MADKKKPSGLKSILIVILIIVVLILIIIWVITIKVMQLGRYWRMKDTSNLYHLSLKYPSLPRASEHRVVISFTTIPDRIKYLGPTLASIFDQTVKVDEICLNVPFISRKGLKYKIPKWLQQLKGVTIYRVEKDEGPGTKLLPTLRRERDRTVERTEHGHGFSMFHDTRIIAIDDDNIYHPDTICHLVDTFEDNISRGRISAMSNYGLILDRSGKIPGIKHRADAMFCGQREIDLLQGFSGFIVTPSMFPERAYEIKDCPDEAISVDDIWFSGWLKLNGIPIESTGSIYMRFPQMNNGKMRKTPALAKNENKNFVTDQIVVDWLINDMGFPLVRRGQLLCE